MISDKRKEYMKEYSRKHKEIINNRAKEYNKKNKEKVKEYHKKWWEEHKEEINRKRREQRKNNKKNINEKTEKKCLNKIFIFIKNIFINDME